MQAGFERKKKNFFGRLLGYLFQGILLTVPLAITVFVIYKLITFINDIIPQEIPYGDGENEVIVIHPFPGFGLLCVLGIFLLVGLLGSSFIAQPIINYFQRLLNRAPLLKTIYSAIKDLVSAFVGKKKTFNQPVLVKVNKDAEMEKLGFLTQEDLSELGIKSGKVAVYMPHSYAWSGNLFIVPRESITVLDTKSADVMKFIVSGGATNIEQE